MMKAIKKIYLFVFFALLINFNAFAQYAAFMPSGRIIFERKINTFAAIKIFWSETRQIPEEQIAERLREYRAVAPQFWTDSFDLYFNNKASIYVPKNPDVQPSQSFYIPASHKNTVYHNLTTNETISEKALFEKNILIKDTTRKIKWKLTGETREIAGYQCFRANAIIMDSIYLVAFYTDEIPTKSGPESITGLPGMILGVALPQQHISIFATKVEGIETAPAKWKIPNEGKNKFVKASDFNSMSAKLLKQFNLTSHWVQSFMEL